MTRRVWLPLLCFAAALAGPPEASAQGSARTTLHLSLLGGHVRPDLGDLNEVFARHRAAETAGAPLGADPEFRRGVAGMVSGRERFRGGVSGGMEIGASRPTGAADGASGAVGLALHVGYDRISSAYRTEFSGGTGGREERIETGRAMLVPRVSRVWGPWSGGVGLAGGVVRVRYRSEQSGAIVGPSGLNPSIAGGGFSGSFSTWGGGGFVEGARLIGSDLSLTARAGYEYVAPREVIVAGADLDAAVRDQNSNPYPERLGFPGEDGILAEPAAKIELSGFRLHVGVRYRLRI